MTNISIELVELLKEKGLTLATAESCTGGLVAKCITDVSGASSVFYGGVVSYDNKVKMGVLGVKEETLRDYGAVSSYTAQEMAIGTRRACFTDIGISTTGIAGPTGGTPEKPVGTVYIGACLGDKVFSKRLNIDPSFSRERIREEAVRELISYIICKIKENY